MLTVERERVLEERWGQQPSFYTANDGEYNSVVPGLRTPSAYHKDRGKVMFTFRRYPSIDIVDIDIVTRSALPFTRTTSFEIPRCILVEQMPDGNQSIPCRIERRLLITWSEWRQGEPVLCRTSRTVTEKKTSKSYRVSRCGLVEVLVAADEWVQPHLKRTGLRKRANMSCAFLNGSTLHLRWLLQMKCLEAWASVNWTPHWVLGAYELLSGPCAIRVIPFINS